LPAGQLFVAELARGAKGWITRLFAYF